jgi:hypothetical protein
VPPLGGYGGSGRRINASEAGRRPALVALMPIWTIRDQEVERSIQERGKDMFPGANENLRRLQRFRSIAYLILVVVGFAILGIKTFLAH